MPAQPLSGLDMAFLCLDDRGMPMTMGALALFSPGRPVHPRRLAELLVTRAQRLDRLRSRPRLSWYPLGGAEWAADPDFSAAHHVHTHSLPTPHREDDLMRLVAAIMAQPLDRSRPLWEAHVIAGLPHDRFGLLLKLHHALADGAGAAVLAAGLFDGFEPPESAPATWPFLADLRTAGRALMRPAGLTAVVRRATESAGIVAEALRAARPAAALSALLAPPDDPRRLATVRLNRDDILRVRKIHGGTTNDVVLSVLSGAVRDCLLSRGLPPGRQVRALVPVSIRRGAGGRDRGNHLSGYLCDLPADEADPAARLREVRARMDACKASGAARGPGAIPLLAARVPTVLHRLAGPMLRRGAPLLFDTVITNVPVPDVPLRLDGAELEELYPIVPLGRGVLFTAAIATYRNFVHLCLQTPARGVFDVSELAAATPRALAALHRSISDIDG